jgi:hypothetical protein
MADVVDWVLSWVYNLGKFVYYWVVFKVKLGLSISVKLPVPIHIMQEYNH